MDQPGLVSYTVGSQIRKTTTIHNMRDREMEGKIGKKEEKKRNLKFGTLRGKCS